MKPPLLPYSYQSKQKLSWNQAFQEWYEKQKPIRLQAKGDFYTLLAVMLQSGIPMVKALDILADKVEGYHFGRVIKTLSMELSQGKSLHQAMLRFPEVFAASEVGVVKSGEAVGRLPELLQKMADQSVRMSELFLKVRGAMIYPSTVLVALMISGVLVVQFVLPKLQLFFDQGGVALPWLTRLVLGLGSFMIQGMWLLIFVAIALILGLKFFFQSDQGLQWKAEKSLSLWVLGPILQKLQVANSIQLLGLLLDSGLPVHEALSISASAVDHPLYRQFLEKMRLQVEQGSKLAPIFESAPHLYPPTVVAMVEVGESTGTLSQLLLQVATHFQRELDHALTQMVQLLEPIIIAVVGAAVGLLAIAILSPIFSLSTAVV